MTLIRVASEVSKMKIDQVMTICKFTYVFLNELSSSIGLFPETTPISISPYRITLTELKD
ncbi:hypothetical protein EPI10_001141 [Gossypium australe]|uniref:Uncharacterized protein n=1 Tax=Gossypium australe TaxID=47621 RepID=A0A5B6VAC4_9ROSI|nr:hypothetical protein EPI10_001141 [Gossypium australe]